MPATPPPPPPARPPDPTPPQKQGLPKGHLAWPRPNPGLVACAPCRRFRLMPRASRGQADAMPGRPGGPGGVQAPRPIPPPSAAASRASQACVCLERARGATEARPKGAVGRGAARRNLRRRPPPRAAPHPSCISTSWGGADAVIVMDSPATKAGGRRGSCGPRCNDHTPRPSHKLDPGIGSPPRRQRGNVDAEAHHHPNPQTQTRSRRPRLRMQPATGGRGGGRRLSEGAKAR